MQKFGIVIHGGAGTMPRQEMLPEREKIYRQALQDALDTGYAVLKSGGPAIDAVEQAVRSLEDNPVFNAGRGSVFTHEGKHEMDAAIMDGNLRAGAVAGISGVRNPVTLARAVMEKSEHVLLSGKGAEAFARTLNIPF